MVRKTCHRRQKFTRQTEVVVEDLVMEGAAILTLTPPNQVTRGPKIYYFLLQSMLTSIMSPLHCIVQAPTEQ